jgi:hypothetical protein
MALLNRKPPVGQGQRDALPLQPTEYGFASTTASHIQTQPEPVDDRLEYGDVLRMFGWDDSTFELAQGLGFPKTNGGTVKHRRKTDGTVEEFFTSLRSRREVLAWADKIKLLNIQ